MRTLAWALLRDFARSHAGSEAQFREFYRTCEAATWSSFAELKADFPSADLAGKFVIFNIRGNRYRVLAVIDFKHKFCYLRWVGTHAEYDRLDLEEL